LQAAFTGALIGAVAGIVLGEVWMAAVDAYPAPPRAWSFSSDGRGGVSYELRSRGGDRRQLSLRRRPESAVRRVVLLGGEGLHAGREPALLDAMLRRRLHQRMGGAWEVVNLASPGFSSSDVRRLGEQVLEALDPDVLVVQCGHHEFSPERIAPDLDRVQHPLLSRLLGPLQAFRLGRAAREALLDRRRASGWRAWVEGAPAVLADSWIEPARETLLGRYQTELERLADRSLRSHAHLVLVEPASNSRELGPLSSAFSKPMGAAARKRYREDLVAARRQLAAGERERARRTLDSLAARDPGVAELVHLQAGLRWEAGDVVEARILERRALALDERAWAASEAVLRRLQTVADLHFQEVCSLHEELERPPVTGEPQLFQGPLQPSAYGQYLLACRLAAAIDPEREDPIEPYPAELGPRLREYRDLITRLDVDAEHLRSIGVARLQAFTEHAARSASPAPLAARARKLLQDRPERLQREAPLSAIAYVLALLAEDSEDARVRLAELRRADPDAAAELRGRLSRHPRLGPLMREADGR